MSDRTPAPQPQLPPNQIVSEASDIALQVGADTSKSGVSGSYLSPESRESSRLLDDGMNYNCPCIHPSQCDNSCRPMLPPAAERDDRSEVEAQQRNIRDTFEALVTMRDGINERIPMPSLESDLRLGPETSVFCSVVTVAVVTAFDTLTAERNRMREALHDLLTRPTDPSARERAREVIHALANEKETGQ